MYDKQRSKADVDKKRQYRIYTVNKLASYFGVPKADLIADTNVEEEILFFPTLSDMFHFNIYIKPVHIEPKRLSLSILFNGDKFVKQSWFDEFLTGEQGDDHYVLAIHISENDIFVVYRAIEYNGYGGAFTITPQGNFVFEPIKNYLKARWPKGDVEEL